MKDLQGIAFLVAINLLNVSQAASVAEQFEFLAGKAFFSTSGEKISFDNGEFAWNKDLADTEPAAITGRYLSSADAVLLQPNNSSAPLSVRIEPASGQLVLNSVTYSWGSGSRNPATPAPPTGNADDLNEQFGYLAGKQFTAASGFYYFEGGRFQLESPNGSLQGQYVVRDGAINLIFDNSSQASRTVVVRIVDGTVTDQSSGVVYAWGVAHSGSSTANPTPNPGSNTQPPALPPVSGVPQVPIVPVTEQFEFLKGKGFSDVFSVYYAFSKTTVDGRGTITRFKEPGESAGSYFIDNDKVYIQFPNVYSLQEPVPILVFPATASFVISPDKSLRGDHALADSIYYPTGDVARALARIKYLGGKIFRGESGLVAFDSNFSGLSFSATGRVEVLDYMDQADPLVVNAAISAGSSSRGERKDDDNLTLTGMLNNGQTFRSTLFLDDLNNTLIVNGKGYVWLGESSTDYSENVTKPNFGWLMGKTFTSTQGNQLSFSNASYTLVAADGRTLDSGIVRSEMVSVYLAHLGSDNMTVKDIFPLEVNINGSSIIYKGETFSWH